MIETPCPHPDATNGEHFWARYPVDPKTGARIKNIAPYGAFGFDFALFCMRCDAAGQPPRKAALPEPFKSEIGSEERAHLEKAANYHKEHNADDVSSWSDTKLKEYVARKTIEAPP